MISKEENKRLSKLLSYTLRHNPAHLDLRPDKNGWVNVDELLHQLNKKEIPVTRETLDHLVVSNDKKRFKFSEDGLRIRASQGHSIEIELNYIPSVPPAMLFHGTAEKNLPSIMTEGLLPMGRHHVHLSADKETAKNVGGRHGKPVVLIINALRMHEEGKLFYISDNGVWLTENVEISYLM